MNSDGYMYGPWFSLMARPNTTWYHIKNTISHHTVRRLYLIEKVWEQEAVEGWNDSTRSCPLVVFYQTTNSDEHPISDHLQTENSVFYINPLHRCIYRLQRWRASRHCSNPSWQYNRTTITSIMRIPLTNNEITVFNLSCQACPTKLGRCFIMSSWCSQSGYTNLHPSRAPSPSARWTQGRPGFKFRGDSTCCPTKTIINKPARDLLRVVKVQQKDAVVLHPARPPQCTRNMDHSNLCTLTFPCVVYDLGVLGKVG